MIIKVKEKTHLLIHYHKVLTTSNTKTQLDNSKSIIDRVFIIMAQKIIEEYEKKNFNQYLNDLIDRDFIILKKVSMN